MRSENCLSDSQHRNSLHAHHKSRKSSHRLTHLPFLKSYYTLQLNPHCITSQFPYHNTFHNSSQSREAQHYMCSLSRFTNEMTNFYCHKLYPSWSLKFLNASWLHFSLLFVQLNSSLWFFTSQSSVALAPSLLFHSSVTLNSDLIISSFSNCYWNYFEGERELKDGQGV